MNDLSCDTSYWRPASHKQLRLLKAWEEQELKRQLQSGLLMILLISAFYFYLTLDTAGIDYLRSIVLFYVLALAMGLPLWGLILYEDQKELWNAGFYVRTVTCIGHTEIRTRYDTRHSLDILGDAGEILEEVPVTRDVLDATRHQDRLLAFTKTPDSLKPLRLVPLRFPGKNKFFT